MNKYIHKLKIGNVELENNVFLAPMAGVTDKAYRVIYKEFGPGLVWGEMASSRAMYYGDEKTKELIDTAGEKRPVAIQIFGNNPEIMAKSVEKVSEYADIIDINAGCPAPKIVKNGDGSKLLLDLDLFGEIIFAVKKASSKPVTVKIRKGWDDKNIVATEAARIAENAGADGITIHGRTRQQYYSGQVDLEIIKLVKESVDIPVIGNGDIKSVADSVKMFEETKVDGIMIGRGALGNPWIFKEILYGCSDVGGAAHSAPKATYVSNQEKLETIIKHINLAVRYKGENIGIKEMRKQICWYIKNLKNSSEIRNEVNKLETKQQVIDCLTTYFKTI